MHTPGGSAWLCHRKDNKHSVGPHTIACRRFRAYGTITTPSQSTSFRSTSHKVVTAVYCHASSSPSLLQSYFEAVYFCATMKSDKACREFLYAHMSVQVCALAIFKYLCSYQGNTRSIIPAQWKLFLSIYLFFQHINIPSWSMISQREILLTSTQTCRIRIKEIIFSITTAVWKENIEWMGGPSNYWLCDT